ncbi:hypothetical protein D6789_04075, partial [Candidatus Woesearchaeota archaeon]
MGGAHVRSVPRRPLRKRWGRRGILFTTDAIFASLLILAATAVVLQHFRAPDALDETSYYAHDTLHLLSTLTLREIKHPDVVQLISEGADPEKTVLEQIGTYWATNDTARAQNLTAAALEALIPERFSTRLSFNMQELYQAGTATTQTGVSTHRRMITGIAQGEALSGATSIAYVSHIQGRELSSTVYFGGFVGQGNITTTLWLPHDVNASGVVQLLLEADITGDFQVFLNGNQCLGTFTPTKPGNFTPELWNLTVCAGNLTGGGNRVEIRFPNTVNDAAIAGGFLRADYTSNAFQETTDFGHLQQYLPGINGIVNLYDSFIVPGQLDGLAIHLHYFANHTNTSNLTFYMTVGNTTIYVDDNSTTPQEVTLTNATLASLLNYSQLDATTVPIRIGFQNLSFASTLFGSADVIIVTDVSGSMAWRFDNNHNGVARN